MEKKQTEKLTEKKLQEINDRIDKGKDTDEDIEILTQYFVEFMGTLGK